MKPFCYPLLYILIAILGLWGCRTSDELTGLSPDQDISKADSSQVNYTAIYVIHGDANYLYHNQKGKPLQADEEKVKEAKSVAQQAKQGEVFIFYQRPEQKILWLFPRKDRVLLHYRNGQLVHREKYSPASSDSSFVTESKLFKKYQSENHSRNYFLYFGHEIPHLQERSYHKSRPHAVFNTKNFAVGVGSFLDKGSKFELTVLSTCDNGTPTMATKMQSKSRYLLASPQNLHLSYIDTYPLLTLEKSPEISTYSLADTLAQQTFDRLRKFLQTAITLSIYDLEKMNESLGKLSAQYTKYQGEKSGSSFEQENTDCATLPFWDDDKVSKGIQALYKPSGFGANADRATHSGWGCQN